MVARNRNTVLKFLQNRVDPWAKTEDNLWHEGYQALIMDQFGSIDIDTNVRKSY